MDTSQQQLWVQISLPSAAADQVHHAHDLCVAADISELPANKVFDDLPHWDDDAAQDEQVLFKAEMASPSADEFFDDKPLPQVIWDEQSEPDLSLHGLLQHLAQGGERKSATEAFTNSLPHILVWDEMPANCDRHDGLLEQLAMGNEYMAEEKTSENTITNTKLDFSDVPTHSGDLTLFLESNVSTAGKVFADIDKDLFPGPEQVYEPSAAGTQQEGSSILLSPSNKISDSFGDCESLELCVPRALFLEENTMECPLDPLSPNECIPGGHLLLQGCAISFALYVLAEMPCHGSTNRLTESMRPCFSAKQSCPGILRLTFTYMQSDMISNKYENGNGDAVLFGFSDTRPWDPGLPHFQFLLEFKVACTVITRMQPWARNAFSPGKIEQQMGKYRMVVDCIFGAYMIWVD